MPRWPVCSKGVGEVSIQTTPAGDKIRPQLILVLPDAGKSQEAVSAGGSGAGPPPALPCPAGGEHTLGGGSAAACRAWTPPVLDWAWP